MSIRVLPAFDLPTPGRPLQFDLSPATLERWNSGLRMDNAPDNAIAILGIIGSDFWSDGITPRAVQNRLREIGARDVVVNINSPGGDFFDGQAIFNLLRAHPHQVTVNVLGMAASAASVIAMAGDKILMPKASWMMIHNVWTVAVGDRHVLSTMIGDMENFDRVSAELYADRTKGDAKKIAKMMDAETFLSGQEAVDQGFADGILEAAAIKDGGDSAAQSAVRKMEAALARAGMVRSERRKLIKEFLAGRSSAAGGLATPSAGDDGMPRAAGVSSDTVSELETAMRSLEQSATALKS
jgi:ATP-dependent Clp protease protease subunit